MGDKSNLLNKLKIDRSEQSSSNGLKPYTVIAIVMVAIVLSNLFMWMLLHNPDEIKRLKVTTDNTTSQATSNIRVIDSVKQPANNQVVRTNKILNASGYITARRMATVSAEIMGLIIDVNVEEGMSVAEGQVLAVLDSALAKVDLQLAKAQMNATNARLGRIETSLTEAKRVLARFRQLGEGVFSSKASVTQAQSNVDSLEADVVSTRADAAVRKLEVQRQQERLDNHQIRAPFAGVVTVKNAQPGEIVAPASAGGGFTRTGICTIVDMASLEIEVDVNEAFIGRVFQGQKVEANLDAYPEWTIDASVIAVIPTADRAKATVRVRIALHSKDSRILPDMGVKVAFIKSEDYSQ